MGARAVTTLDAAIDQLIKRARRERVLPLLQAYLRLGGGLDLQEKSTEVYAGDFSIRELYETNIDRCVGIIWTKAPPAYGAFTAFTYCCATFNGKTHDTHVEATLRANHLTAVIRSIGLQDEPWFVYMVRTSRKAFYTGVTKNVEHRVWEHNNSTRGAKALRGQRPVRLVWTRGPLPRAEALWQEAQIKKVSHASKREMVRNYK